MNKHDLVIVGAGGFAREVAWLADETDSYSLLGFLDDRLEVGMSIGSSKVLGKLKDAARFKEAQFAIAIGAPRTRRKIFDSLREIGVANFATLVHPSVRISPSVRIGNGSMICAGAVLTIDIEIGNHVIVNINATIGHDCRIGDFCTIAPLAAISGNVTMETGVEVGTGASVRQGLRLGEGSMLGMGGTLTKDIPRDEIFVGNPAKFLKRFSNP